MEKGLPFFGDDTMLRMLRNMQCRRDNDENRVDS
jgi:hypothetical protein